MTDPLVVTSAGLKPGRKFLRAFRCSQGTVSSCIRGAPGARRLLLAGGPVILLLAAIAPGARPAAVLVLFAGWLTLRALRSPTAITWAAVLPVAALVTWPWVLGPDAPIGELACRDPLSSVAVRRMVAAAAVLGLVAFLARQHGSSPDEIGLRRPTRPEAALALAGAIALASGGLLIGPAIAEPFFGQLAFPVPVAALAPAMLFGIANGVVEEVAYRGTMQAWLGRAAPIWGAIVFQGLVFGIVHAGPEVITLLPVHIALLTGVGIAGGIVRARTSSLAIPIGIHVGADIALYVGLACRPMS